MLKYLYLNLEAFIKLLSKKKRNYNRKFAANIPEFGDESDHSGEAINFPKHFVSVKLAVHSFRFL